MHKFVSRVEVDGDAESSREWDNLGTMACAHRRYSLGDAEERHSGPEEWAFKKAAKYSTTISRDIDDISKAWKILEKHWIVLPLYLYDHSGLKMSTSSFSCRWDSGQVGYIYVEKAKVLNDFGWTRLNKQRIKRVYDCFDGEVETYNKYLNGDVYNIRIDEVDGDGNVVEEGVENCGGFYGRDYAECEAKRMVEALTKDMQIKSKVMFGATQQLLVF